MRNKIALVGAGNIGGELAHIAMTRNLADVVMIDIADGIPQGKSLDISQLAASTGSNNKSIGSNNYEVMQGADVVIVTAGIARKPGMSRDDLIGINEEIVADVATAIKTYAPNAFVIVITNPLDVMAWVMYRKSGLPAHKVVGMAGILDSARFKNLLSDELGVAASSIQALVLGGHGDTMVPMIKYTTVGGISLLDLIKVGMISKERVDELVQRTRDGGAEIVKYLKTGSAYFAPAASAIEMAESYLQDAKKVLPTTALLSGQYGYKDIFIGIPTVIGKGGIEKIIELPLDTQEKEMFDYSAQAVISLMKNLKQTN